MDSKLEQWLKDPWWPPSFLQRPFRWKLPVIIGVICAACVAYLAGGPQSVWVLLISLNAVIYVGVPFAIALVIFWKSKGDRGRLIACDIASCLMVLLFLVPGNVVGQIYVSRNIEKSKRAGMQIAERLASYSAKAGHLPSNLKQLAAETGPLPNGPFPVEYRLDTSSGLYELRIADPTCVFRCFWIFNDGGKDWRYVSG
jgi:hypothetical protein